MPIQLPYIQPLSFQQNNPVLTGFTQGLQNQGQAAQNQILNAQAQYAPYSQYADALLKTAQAQYLPLQYMAAPLSNPLFMAAMSQNPGQLQDYMSRFANASSALPGQGLNLPIPGQAQPRQGLFEKLSSLLSSNTASNSNNQSDNQGLVNVPGLNGAVATPQMAAQVGSQINNLQPGQSYTIPGDQQSSGTGFGSPGLTQRIINRQLAPFNSNPETGKGTGLGGGTTYIDPQTGQVYSSLTTKQASQAQQSAAALQRLSPLLNRIANEAAPFQTYGGKLNLLQQKLLNPLSQNPTGKLPTQNAQLEADLETAPESYVKAWGINPTDQTLAAMKGAVEPRLGESADQYKQRIIGTLNNLKAEELAQAQDQLKSGINLNNQVPGQPYAGPSFSSLQNNPQSTLGRYGSQAGDPNAGLINIANPSANKAVQAPITKTLNGVNYTKINGQWYVVK